jgi:hypothetical protein
MRGRACVSRCEESQGLLRNRSPAPRGGGGAPRVFVRLRPPTVNKREGAVRRTGPLAGAS